MSDHFAFEHEGIRAVTIDGVTFIAVTDMTTPMILRTADRMLGVASQADPSKAMDEILFLDGQGDAFQFVEEMSRHMAHVSVRLQNGLTAHEDDEVDVETQVREFADALAEVDPDDFR